MKKLTKETKTKIKVAFKKLGGDPGKLTPTHNGDGWQHCIDIVYRAWNVFSRNWKMSDVKNASKKLPGGITVAEVLIEAKNND